MSERLYRLQSETRAFYAVERDGVLSELDGDCSASGVQVRRLPAVSTR